MNRHNPEHVLARWVERAEKAEQERDEALAATCTDKDAHWRLDEAQETIERLTRERDEARARLAGVTIAVPDITVTDEMVERAFVAADRYGAVVINMAIMREALTAALTEPPTRPEGAEEIEAAIRAWDENGDTNADHGDWDNLADFLASRGVRVVTEEQP